MNTSAEREALRRADAAARLRVQQEFDAPLLLEAGAGTGKTTVLVARVVAWCLGPGWERHAAVRASAAGSAGIAGDPPGASEIASRVLSRVVAITFTEAAAAEMSQRISAAFSELARGITPLGVDSQCLPGDAPLAPRAAALLAAADQLRVQTIHAFCLRLLRQEPLAAGLHPRLSIDADGRLRDQALREVLAEALPLAAAGEDAERLFALAARGVGPAELEGELRELLEAGVDAERLEADPLAAERVSELLARLESACSALAEWLGERAAAVGGVAARAGESLERSLACLRAASGGALDALDELVHELQPLWGKSELDRLRDWSRSDFTKGEGAAFGAEAGAIASAAGVLRPLLIHAAQLDPQLLALARPVLLGLLRRVEAWLQTRGAISFEGILAAAARLVRQPALCQRLRADIDQLLVDEFQDTDRLQCELVRALALGGSAGERPGLFLVGDPKQSIYGWRNADLAAYDAFKQELVAAGGRRALLVVNHRSVPAILAEVERVIEPIMQERRGLQARFEPLLPGEARSGEPGFAAGRFATVEHWLPARRDPDTGGIAKTRSTEATQLEAAALAQELRELHAAGGVEWGRVAVLFRSRSDWDCYLLELRRCAVPFAVEGDRSYYRRREIVEAAALLRAVVDPGDDIALVGFLRSACVGVPDAALAPLFEQGLGAALARVEGECEAALGEVEALARSVAAALDPEIPGLSRIQGWEENLIDAARSLGALRRAFAELPGDAFVEALRSATLFEASESARHLGLWRRANLERFFRELAERLGSGEELAALLAELRRAVEDEQEAPEAQPPEQSAGAVQIMTIHNAKGLDFDHVYVMQLHKGVGRSRGLRAGALRDELLRFEYQLFGARTPGFDRLERELRELEAAERVRALYVALTRAKQRLVISALPPAWLEHRSEGALSELLLQRRDGAVDPEDLASLPRSAGRASLERAGARWSLLEPAGEAPPEIGTAERGAEAQAGGTPERDPLATARDWALRRARARARMALPLAGRASDADPRAWREQRAESREVEAGDRSAGVERGLARAAAQLLGSAVHRALERLELGDGSAAPAAQLRATFSSALGALADGAAPELFEAARAAGEVLVDRICSGAFPARLQALGSGLIARELPVLLPGSAVEFRAFGAAPGAEAAAAARGPLAYTAGAIDLLYRDPESGELVVADYKTDALPVELSDAELREHAERYRPQLARYGAAVADALGLPAPPRLELWFLALGRAIALPAGTRFGSELPNT